MTGPGSGSPVPVGAIAAAGLLVAALLWNERQKSGTQRASSPPDEVALYQGALTAVEQAKAQIHLARHYADALRECAVDFDVQAKVEPAFTDDLASKIKSQSDTTSSRRPMLFMVDGQERLPALKDTVERFLPVNRVRQQGGEMPSARSILREAIDTSGGLWSASKALITLQESGWSSKGDRPLNVVGNLLAAMARDEEIKRAGRGMYTSLRPPPPSVSEQEVAPGVFAREEAPGVWIITGMDPAHEVPEGTPQAQ